MADDSEMRYEHLVIRRALWFVNTSDAKPAKVLAKLRVLAPGAKYSIDFGRGSLRPRQRGAVRINARRIKTLRARLSVVLGDLLEGTDIYNPSSWDWRASWSLTGAVAIPYFEKGKLRVARGSVVTPTLDGFAAHAAIVLRDQCDSRKRSTPFRIWRCKICKKFEVISRQKRGHPPVTCDSVRCQKDWIKLRRAGHSADQ